MPADFEDTIAQAVANGSVADLKTLLKDRADANAYVEYDGYEGYALGLAIEKGNSEIIRLLIENGADTKELAIQAIQEGSLEELEFLLKHGADLDADVSGVYEYGYSYKGPLLALALEKGNEDIARLLLENGAAVRELTNRSTADETGDYIYAYDKSPLKLLKKILTDMDNFAYMAEIDEVLMDEILIKEMDK
jgi:ankyrin repeat protein